MSNKKISYLQALCSMSDDYLEHIDTLNNTEIHNEHKEMFGDDSQGRIETIQNLFNNVIMSKKKNIVSNISFEIDEVRCSDDVVSKIKNRYGSLKNFFESKFMKDSDIPSELTLQYRNMENITDEDITLLIEALYANGDLKIEDDKY